MNPRNRTPALLLVGALCATLAPMLPLRSAPAEDDPVGGRMALLDFEIGDDDGWGLPGVTVELRSMGGSRDTESFFAITNASGRCTLPVPSGATHLLTASLDGFIPVRLLGVEVASGFLYQVPQVAMGVGEGKPRDHVWNELLTPGPPPEESAFAEWLDENPDAVGDALLRSRGVRVLPLPHAPEAIVHLSVGDWDELAGASITLSSEDHRYFAFVGPYGACRLVLDQPGTYTIRVEHPTIGTRQITGVELLGERIYTIETELEDDETSWTELVGDYGAYATSYSGEYIDLEEE